MWSFMPLTVTLICYYYQFFVTHSLFHSRLKTFFCKSFPLQPSSPCGRLSRLMSAFERTLKQHLVSYRLLSDLSFPLRIDPLRFQARCHKRRLNLALVFCVNFMLSYVLFACVFDLVVLDLVFICNDLVYIFVFFMLAQVIFILCSLTLFCWVQFIQYRAKRLAGKNVSEMTYFVSTGT